MFCCRGAVHKPARAPKTPVGPSGLVNHAPTSSLIKRRSGKRMQAVELISKKRDGQTLSTAEINWLVEHYTKGDVPDYQMAAWLMAVYWRSMDARETSDLTLAMMHSGEQLRVRDIVSP